MLKENSGTRREQRCSTQYFDRQGNIYHPTLLRADLHTLMCLYKELLQTFSDNHAANEAGAAAKSGELKKDNRHDNNVTEAGGLFYPLLVETYGVWSTHSLEVIKLIAKRSSLLNGQTLSKPFCNLHEQLSCRLWQYNAKLILEKLALVAFDVDSSFNYGFSRIR